MSKDAQSSCNCKPRDAKVPLLHAPLCPVYKEVYGTLLQHCSCSYADSGFAILHRPRCYVYRFNVAALFGRQMTKAEEQEGQDLAYVARVLKADNPELDNCLKLTLRWIERYPKLDQEIEAQCKYRPANEDRLSWVKNYGPAVTTVGCILAEKAHEEEEKEWFRYAAMCFHRGAQLNNSCALHHLGVMFAGSYYASSCTSCFFFLSRGDASGETKHRIRSGLVSCRNGCRLSLS